MKAVFLVVVAMFSTTASAKECTVGQPCGASCIEWTDHCSKAVIDRAPTCVVGCECGDACIECSDTCHVGGSYSAPTTVEPDYSYCELQYPAATRMRSPTLQSRYSSCLSSARLNASSMNASAGMIHGLRLAEQSQHQPPTPDAVAQQNNIMLIVVGAVVAPFVCAGGVVALLFMDGQYN